MRNQSLHLAECFTALGAFALFTATAGNATAQTTPDCSTLPNPVVIAGSSAVASFVQTVATALAAQTDPITVIYQKPGSCGGLGSLITPAGQSHPVYLTGTGIVWDASGTQTNCNITGDTLTPDVAISDVFPTTCPGISVPSGMKEFRGPVQSMTFAVYKDSDYHVISGEAAYLTLGLGNDSTTPWNDVTHIWERDQNSGTQQMIGATIGIAANKFIAADTNTPPSNSVDAAHIISNLQATAGNQDLIDVSIGILGMDAIRGNAAGDVIPLAYQHFGQTAGYYPSSSLDSNDMQNTRDGHYMIQGPVHMVTPVDGSGVPTNANAKTLIDYLTGATVPATFDLIALEAAKSIVPDCAMRVKRDEEAGPFMSYMPPHSCECKFLKEAAQTVPNDCATCDHDSDCTNTSRPVCNYGFCEVQ